jgi:hypothetical protein
VLLQAQALPCTAQLQRWQACVWLFPLGMLLLAMGQAFWGALALLLAVLGWLVTLRARRLWQATRHQVGMLAESVRGVDAVGPLLDFARWQGHEAAECHAALERLLPRLDTERARQLTEEQRRYLRQSAENQDPTVEFAVAALLVLASADDTATIPIARKLAVSSSSQRIRDAAHLSLEELGGKES